MESILEEMSAELTAILNWWRRYSVDNVNGGFYGSVDEQNMPDHLADKGSVLNCRILWTFSSGYGLTADEDDLAIARRAYRYIVTTMLDTTYGGIYWSVSANGSPGDMHKQIYAQAFAVYAFSEYAKVTGDQQAVRIAIGIFELIEQFSFDEIFGGYTDSFERDWQERPDQRLSAKEINAPKTMNTHLHLIEAYANLYEVWPTVRLKEKATALLRFFLDRFIDKQTFHLQQFFDAQGKELPCPVSYGHDIEAAWLICECAEKLNLPWLLDECRTLSLKLIDAALEGLDEDGGLWYEFDPRTNETIFEKHWWPQAETQVALFHAWQLTKKKEYLEKRKLNWSFISSSIRNHRYGEWIWGITGSKQGMPDQDKAGFWKGPYHNSRCCQELIKRIRNEKSDTSGIFL